MHRKFFCLAGAAFLFFLWGCQQKQGQNFGVYRLIDHLGEQEILASPLSTQPSGEFRAGFPTGSSLLKDWGSGDNPRGMKRKLRVGGTERNILFCPPETHLRYEMDPWENSFLEFAVGIVAEEASGTVRETGEGEKKGVSFRVVLKAEGQTQTIFQKYLPPPESKEAPAYSFHRLKMPFIEKGMHLSLITKGNEQSASFWFNPVLYEKQERTHKVILISIDTLRADHLGCYGYHRDTSPHIDQLASESVTFLNTFASSPWTLPSHVSLLTALHGVHHQVYYNDESMDPGLITLADAFRNNHYLCAAFTGGGFVSSVYGLSKGFDAYSNDAGDVFRQDAAGHLFKLTSSWLDQNMDKNFFLFLHTYQTHNPYACPYPYKTQFIQEGAKWRHLDLRNYLGGSAGVFKELGEEERSNIIGLYDGEIRYTDEQLIGPLVEKLKKTGIFDQTMIVFTSDHGEEFYEHQGWGHGHSLYNESLKVPLIIKFPDSTFSGRRIENVVRLVDVMPTVLDELNIPFPDSERDGKSLLPVIEGREKDHRMFLADIGENVLDSHIPQRIAINSGKNKLLLNKTFSREDLAFFLSPPPVLKAVELYDLHQDPEEERDIADKRADVANRLIQKISLIYKEAEKRKTRKLEMDEELKKQLRALGYIR